MNHYDKLKKRLDEIEAIIRAGEHSDKVIRLFHEGIILAYDDSASIAGKVLAAGNIRMRAELLKKEWAEMEARESAESGRK